MAKVQARALVQFSDAGNKINANDLVEGDAALIKSMGKAGLVDSDKDAVAYCKSLGAKPIEIIGDGFDALAAENAAYLKKQEEAADDVKNQEVAATE